MGDIITTDERALIDSAVRAGRVTCVPSGAHTTTVDYVWDDESGQLLPRDTTRTGGWRSNRFQFGGGQGRAVRRPSDQVMDRRKKLRQIANEATTCADLASELGVPVYIVRRDVRVLGLMVARGGGGGVNTDQHNAAVARRIEIKRLFDSGLSRAAICEELSLSESTVSRHLRAMGVESRRAVLAARVVARRAEVRDLHGRGLTIKQMIAVTGSNRAQIASDLGFMGLRAHRSAAQYASQAERIARRVDVTTLIRAGWPVQKIAEKWSVVARVIYNDIAVARKNGVLP